MRSAALPQNRPDDVQLHHRLPPPQKDMPLRLLLIREKRGELPWVVQTIMDVMAPVDLVQVSGLGNAIWRLGHERFDSVLLDLGPRPRQVVDLVRRHIADVAAVPVLDLNADPIAPASRGAPERSVHEPPAEARAVRLPERSREADGQQLQWPPRAGRGGDGAKRKTARSRIRAPFLAAVE